MQSIKSLNQERRNSKQDGKILRTVIAITTVERKTQKFEEVRENILYRIPKRQRNVTFIIHVRNRPFNKNTIRRLIESNVKMVAYVCVHAQFLCYLVVL